MAVYYILDAINKLNAYVKKQEEQLSKQSVGKLRVILIH